jgi:acyl-CoA thioesterase I
MRFMTRLGRSIFLGLALLSAPVGAAEKHPVVPAMAGKIETVAARCEVPADMLAMKSPMPQVAGRLLEGRQLTIVALGSSSTEGVGASMPAHAYPARLETELHALLPHMQIKVLNKGIGGEDVDQMLARFERDVLAPEPDLVIWQAGVNAAIKGQPLADVSAKMSQGIELARSRGIDVMLMGPQNAPRYVNAPHRREYTEALTDIARKYDAPIFPRFRVMTHWMATGAFKQDELVREDGLHMTDAGYYCLARLLARAITTRAQIHATSAQ